MGDKQVCRAAATHPRPTQKVGCAHPGWLERLYGSEVGRGVLRLREWAWDSIQSFHRSGA